MIKTNMSRLIVLLIIFLNLSIASAEELEQDSSFEYLCDMQIVKSLKVKTENSICDDKKFAKYWSDLTEKTNHDKLLQLLIEAAESDVTANAILAILYQINLY